LKSCQFSVISCPSRKKYSEAPVLHLQTLGDELFFSIPNGFLLSVFCCQLERIMREFFFVVTVNSVFLSEKFS
jgi:hypothetical protein